MHLNTSSSGRGRGSNSTSLNPNLSTGERRTPRSTGNARLLEIVEKFAVGFDDLPRLIPERDDYRILISTGVVVRAYTVIAQLVPDGAVELLSLDIDTDWD